MKAKFSRLLPALCSLMLILGLVACSGGTAQQTDGDADPAVSKEERKLDEEVFPKDKVVDVKITIDEDDFQDMLDNASAEEYKTASVDYNGKHFDNIGIRTKGNLSLRSVVQMPDSDRYSFKLSFDEYVNQTLDGISKINLNNNYSDASSMREFLTYELAEKMGLPTPKYSFVNVYVNGELWGFYLAVEQIGDAYLNRHFGNAYGALYKGEMTGSGSDLAWLGDDPDLYTGLALKSKTTNGDVLIDMLDELNNGSDYEKVLNVEHALGYIALNVLTNNMDSYIGGNKQNYYLYEDEGVFSILPWDYNMAFGGMGGGMGGGMRGGFGGRGGIANDNDNAAQGDAKAGITGTEAGVTGKEPPIPADTEGTGTNGNTGATAGGNADNAPNNGNAAEQFDRNNPGRTGGSGLLIDEPTQGAVAERPLVAKLLAVDEYKARYHAILQTAVDGYLANDNFSARANEVYEMIAPYVKADPRPFYTYEEFEQAVPALISTNASQIEKISQQLDGTSPSSGDGSGSGGGFGGGGMPAFGGNANGSADAGPAGFPAPPQGAPGDISDGAAQTPPGGMDGQTPGGDGAPQMPQGGADGQGNPGGQGRQGANGGQWGPPDDDFGGGRGFGGGPMGGGFGGDGPQPQTNPNEPVTVLISLGVLVLGALFVLFFRRKRL
ncbi:CotH kinase family protein [Paenibacillus sp. DYY-L-2]|uniref:CotH kinase family protein n=1 Tax=Paenibacillus sp. DYY-L-2 TaxID=3447013 RepID=UPI003F4F4F9F